MLKTLKWIYDLGVRQERVRIASHLQMHSIGASNSRDIASALFAEEMSKPKPNIKLLDRLNFENAVNQKVEEIIQEIFQSNGEWVSGNSIMFPDGGHLGKVK